MGGHLVTLLPLGAAVFAVPQFVPQLVRVRRLGAPAGVSWTWAAMTCVNNAAWIAYFTLSHLYSALVPATAAVVFAGLLAARIAGLQGGPRGPALAVTGWALGLAAAGVGYGRIGLGTALAAAFFLQVIPSVWTAYRTDDVSGISVGTWLLILGELTCFGLFGMVESDPRLMMLGGTGVLASILMLSRVAWVRWIRLGALSHPEHAEVSPPGHVVHPVSYALGNAGQERLPHLARELAVRGESPKKVGEPRAVEGLRGRVPTHDR